MGYDLPPEAANLGPVRAEYKNNPGQFGLSGSLAILGILFVGIQLCRSTSNDLLSQGFNVILESPREFICGPIAVVSGVTYIAIWLSRLTNRVIVCRDGFVFLRRFPHKVELWRWEDIESVSHKAYKKRNSFHVSHAYVVRGKDFTSIHIEGLKNIQTLGNTIEKEVAKVKRPAESQNMRTE